MINFRSQRAKKTVGLLTMEEAYEKITKEQTNGLWVYTGRGSDVSEVKMFRSLKHFLPHIRSKFAKILGVACHNNDEFMFHVDYSILKRIKVRDIDCIFGNWDERI